MNFRPLGDRVLVKRNPEMERTESGLYIPPTAQEKPQAATVIAIGIGKVLDNGEVVALAVKVGDEILFGKYAGNEFKLDGEDHLILREDEILGVLEEG